MITWRKTKNIKHDCVSLQYYKIPHFKLSNSGKSRSTQRLIKMTVIVGRSKGRMSLINFIGILSAPTALMDILIHRSEREAITRSGQWNQI